MLVDAPHWIALGGPHRDDGRDRRALLRAAAHAARRSSCIPGTLFLVGFQIVPIIYTIDVAFTNYSTGHILKKAEAIPQIQLTSLQPPANGKQYTMAPARDSERRPRARAPRPGERRDLHRHGEGPDAARRRATSRRTRSGSRRRRATRSSRATSSSRSTRRCTRSTCRRPARARSRRRRSRRRSSSSRRCATTRRPTRSRASATASCSATTARARSCTRQARSSSRAGRRRSASTTSARSSRASVRGPFLRIFVWTIVFAASTVFLSFFVGLLLAIVLNKKGLRFQRFYRSLILIPWAVPGFLSLLVWQGLLNDDFGVVNRIFHLQHPLALRRQLGEGARASSSASG